MHFILWTKGSHESTYFDTLRRFWWKFAKLLMSFSKPQVSFSFFLGQTLYTLHKRDQSKCKCFRLLSARIKIHQILVIFETINWFFFTFWITFQYHEIYITSLYFFSWNFIYFQQKKPIKALQIWWNFIWTIKSLKFCTLMGSFCKKHITFQLKKYSYLSWNWRVMQGLKKNWLVVSLSNLTWGIWWIFTQTFKSPKISLRWAIFVQSICGLS